MDRNRALWHAAASGGLYLGVGMAILIFTYKAAQKRDEADEKWVGLPQAVTPEKWWKQKLAARERAV